MHGHFLCNTCERGIMFHWMRHNILIRVKACLPPSLSPPQSSCITIWPSITHSSLHPSICSPQNSLPLPSSLSDQSHLPASPWTHSLYPSLPLRTPGWTSTCGKVSLPFLLSASTFLLLYTIKHHITSWNVLSLFIMTSKAIKKNCCSEFSGRCNK